MARRHKVLLILAAISTLATMVSFAQITNQPQSSQDRLAIIRPLPLPHLYWHFLMIQATIDSKVAEQQAIGNNPSDLHYALQAALGWSDADFAPIHTSAVRLRSKMNDLNARARSTHSTVTTLSNRAQSRASWEERESAINAEMRSLKQQLPPLKIALLESFLTRFFSPTRAVQRRSANTDQQTSGGQR